MGEKEVLFELGTGKQSETQNWIEEREMDEEQQLTDARDLSSAQEGCVVWTGHPNDTRFCAGGPVTADGSEQI